MLYDARASSIRSPSPAFLLRPEHNEAAFVETHAADLRGAVLLGRLLAPYAPGSPQQGAGLRGDELGHAVRRARVAHVHDPDTAILPLLQDDDGGRFGRAAQMASARSVPPGVQPHQLADDARLRELVIATLQPQVSVLRRSTPYFLFTSLNDPWLAVNVRGAAMTQAVTRAQPIAVFVQVDVQALRAGVLALAAGPYAQTLGARGTVFLQVAASMPSVLTKTRYWRTSPQWAAGDATGFA